MRSAQMRRHHQASAGRPDDGHRDGTAVGVLDLSRLDAAASIRGGRALG